MLDTLSAHYKNYQLFNRKLFCLRLLKALMIMKKIFLVCTLLLALFANAQKINRTQLTGRITDSKDGFPLPGASIMFAESRMGTTSDSNGVYSLNNIPLGHTLIEISYQGYKSIVQHVDISEGLNTKDFALVSAIIENEAVTITAVGSATSIRKAPVSITRVSKTELMSAPSSNIIDAISRQPGVSQVTTGPAISKPVIRGLGYNRLVVINDGLRQEGQQWGDEHGIEIDENSVSRIEIVKGPASLIYGSDALAGVVNIITSSPVSQNTLKGTLLGSYSTNNKQRSFFGSIAGNNHGFNWNAWGDYRAAADYRNKYDGRVWNSKFNEKNFGGYGGFNGAWGHSHLIASNFNQVLGVIEGERGADGKFIKALAGGAVENPTEADFNSTDPFIPYQHIRHLKIISDNSFKLGKGRITATLGWQRNQRQEYGNPDAPNEKSLFFSLHTFNYTAAYHITDNKGWNTAIGVGGMAQNNKNLGAEVLIPEYKSFDAGVYIYSQKTFGKSTMSGGLRFDHRLLESNTFIENGDIKFKGFSKTFSNISGSAGVSYAATDNMVVKLNFARGFRAPSIPELASNGAHEGTNRYEYGDENLKSETSWQGDLGVEVNSEHVLFNASGFYNRVNDFIFYRKLTSPSGADSLVDVDGDLVPAYQFGQHNATLIGFEFLADLHPHPFDWLHWRNTLSYVRGKFAEQIEGTNNLPFIPATRWLTELRGELLPKGKFFRNMDLHVELDHSFKQDKPFTAYGTETATAGYSLLNAGVSTDLYNGKKTVCSIFFSANNITDVAYQNHMSRLKYAEENLATGRRGVYNVGRNFVVKVNLPMSFKTK
jgi:iron complex outermembrane recepter protein